MSEKREKILEAALVLFANAGYNAVSTSSIARAAGVSEGLIFRHFKSKKGLLDALTADLEQRITRLLADVIFETDPATALRRYIAMPLEVREDDYPYWRLQFKLKWQQEYNNPAKLKPLADKLTWAFKALNIKAPEHEAQILMWTIDSMAISLLRDGIDLREKTCSYLLDRYKLN